MIAILVSTIRRVCRMALLAPALVLAGGPEPVAPTADSSRLPPLGETWLAANPYRGNAEVIDTGRQMFNQGCAVCHGVDAVGERAPAPDLRGLQAYCRRIEDSTLRAACDKDVDTHFIKVVRKGKTLVGTVHMPAWDGVLRQEQVWAIKTFIEAQRKK
ncbi:MAG: c-type cytochrome [Panacagrimonas sp.]